jgi:plasmid stabilization system protein ParE
VSSFVLTRRALADIFEIWRFIAVDNPSAADLVEEAIFEACGLAARSPLAGHRRPDLTSRNVRFWTLGRYPNYSVVYRPETQPLEVVAVIHGMRDIPRILASR